MGTELAGLIHADLAALTNDAGRLAVAPALDAGQIGQAASSADFSFAQSMKDALASVDQDQHTANDKMAAVESGRSSVALTQQ